MAQSSGTTCQRSDPLVTSWWLSALVGVYEPWTTSPVVPANLKAEAAERVGAAKKTLASLSTDEPEPLTR